ELKIIFKKINSNRVKFCFDTAHAFEAGFLTDYRIDPIRKFFDQWQKEIGLDNIVVIHANDSKTEANSCHDQHENIGQGKIGLTGFKNLAKEKRLRSKDWILEVPGSDRTGPDQKNIIILRSCFS
ncbi:TIM barrel protein, partial [Patescibacteria group bacterium]|nr:TIM barrel protein [Patescibacteria group bacterium]